MGSTDTLDPAATYVKHDLHLYRKASCADQGRGGGICNIPMSPSLLADWYKDISRLTWCSRLSSLHLLHQPYLHTQSTPTTPASRCSRTPLYSSSRYAVAATIRWPSIVQQSVLDLVTRFANESKSKANPSQPNKIVHQSTRTRHIDNHIEHYKETSSVLHLPLNTDLRRSSSSLAY